MIFQPLLQRAVVVAIGVVCLGLAGGYARARADRFAAIALPVPIE